MRRTTRVTGWVTLHSLADFWFFLVPIASLVVKREAEPHLFFSETKMGKIVDPKSTIFWPENETVYMKLQAEFENKRLILVLGRFLINQKPA